MRARQKPDAPVLPGERDPWEVLGVGPQAGDEEVRAAYLSLVRNHSPERDPERFERIRDAYAQLRDPRRRAERMLLSVDPGAPLVSLLRTGGAERRFVGPEPWLAVLEEAR